MMPAGHHSDSDSTLLPLPKSSITWFGGIFCKVTPSGCCTRGLIVEHLGRQPTVSGIGADNIAHSSDAWTLSAAVMRSINGFICLCLHAIAGQDYRRTATSPVFDLLREIRQRRLRYLGHILRMPESRVVRRALMALTGTHYPEGSLLMDCQTIAFENIEALPQRRAALNSMVNRLP